MLMTDEAYKKTISLIESKIENEKDKWTEEQQRIIKELAIEFKRSELYKACEETFVEEIKELRQTKAEDIFTEMAAKIICIPNRLYVEASIMLMIPIIDEILEKRRQQK